MKYCVKTANHRQWTEAYMVAALICFIFISIGFVDATKYFMVSAHGAEFFAGKQHTADIILSQINKKSEQDPLPKEHQDKIKKHGSMEYEGGLKLSIKYFSPRYHTLDNG